jgi:hypothetical protein
MRADTIPALEEFLNRYSLSPSADIIRRERDRLAAFPVTKPAPPPTAAVVPSAVPDDERAWDSARITRSREPLEKFIRDFPGSKHRPDAEILLSSLSPPHIERPLHCGAGKRAEGDQCVQIVCAIGFKVGEGGKCERKVAFKEPPRIPQPQSHRAETSPRQNRSGCYSFNGEKFCN